jgi:hypothetical protein
MPKDIKTHRYPDSRSEKRAMYERVGLIQNEHIVCPVCHMHFDNDVDFREHYNEKHSR